MKVLDVMISEIVTCSPSTNLATVATLMWDNDCGIVPVTDEGGRPIGMITDRDISIAGATQQRLLSDIKVSEVKDNHVVACTSEREVKDILMLMADAKVRRLPVIDADGKLIGLLSMGDIVANVPVIENGGSSMELPYENVIEVLKSIYVHH